ncbi:MAG: hypothetical protein KAZ87_11795 [Spirochaetes bacterium]|nr:hypothetical protein [Spirochaetota bacterium]
MQINHKTNITKVIIFISIIALLTGCGRWAKRGGPYKYSSDRFRCIIPIDWMQDRTADLFLITHDGLDLQMIFVEKIKINEKLSGTKKTFKKDMSAMEQAETIIDNNKSKTSMFNYTVISNKPAIISGENGFRLVTEYRTKDDVRYRNVYYGFMKGDFFYDICYSAPIRHYFDKEFDTFEEFVKSFSLY